MVARVSTALTKKFLSHGFINYHTFNFYCTTPVSILNKTTHLSDNDQFFKVVKTDLSNISTEILQNLENYGSQEILPLAKYYFQLKGKSIRPAIVCLLSKICNNISDINNKKQVLQLQNNTHNLPIVSKSQLKVATFAEMVHTSSLLHDDVIDKANMRRCNPSANDIWGQRKPILAGNFVLALASIELARLGDSNVISLLSKVLRDLVDGELMQLGTKDGENERFKHYLRKTYNKTGSLLAHACKAVAYLADVNNLELQQAAFDCGKNLGVAFQLRDDILDFVSSSEDLGKPSGGQDLISGLATGPLLFACDKVLAPRLMKFMEENNLMKFPYLEPLIQRRFSKSGDIVTALRAVKESDGIQEAQRLAECHSREASNRIMPFMKSATNSELKTAFTSLCDYIVNRQN